MSLADLLPEVTLEICLCMQIRPDVLNDGLSTHDHRIMYWLAFAKKHSKVRHKILKHQENFFFLKIGLDEL